MIGHIRNSTVEPQKIQTIVMGWSWTQLRLAQTLIRPRHAKCQAGQTPLQFWIRIPWHYNGYRHGQAPPWRVAALQFQPKTFGKNVHNRKRQWSPIVSDSLHHISPRAPATEMKSNHQPCKKESANFLSSNSLSRHSVTTNQSLSLHLLSSSSAFLSTRLSFLTSEIAPSFTPSFCFPLFFFCFLLI